MAEAADQNREIKQRAVRRLSVAVVLVLAAVGILTYLSYYKPPKSTPKPVAEALPPPPPPIVSGPEPEALQPATPAEPPLPAPDAIPPASEPATAPPAAAPAPAPAPAVTPPPAPAVVSKPLPKPGPGPKKDSELAKPLVKAEPASAPAAQPAPAPQAAPAPAAAPAKPAPAGYIVQFGVFSNMQNAAQLVERLKQLGIDAQTETKVHLPAFKTKAEADAAMAKMKEKGISAVVVGK